jgi:murein DD-endopeptidase MepM/ murein hydrolase activator NlpD
LRLLIPLVLGVTLLTAIGAVLAVTAFAPSPLTPTGIVADEVHAGLASSAPLPLETAPPAGAGVRAGVPDAHGASPGGAPTVALTGYRWPMAHPRVTLPVGPTPWGEWLVDGEPFHDGVDLATFCGDRIVAAHDGMVIAAGRHFDDSIGWIGDLSAYYARLDAKKLWSTLPIVVVIDDGNGYRSVYAHFGKLAVKNGQAVRAGDLLGYEGRTGHASGCHLHYGLFSPFETAAYSMDPAIVKRMKVPTAEIARIDPLSVFPPRPTPTPKPSPAPTSSANPAPTH